MERYRRIRDLREDADLTQAQVGEAINVPQRTYAYYESGQRMIPPRVLWACPFFHEAGVAYLLERKNKRDLTRKTGGGAPPPHRLCRKILRHRKFL